MAPNQDPYQLGRVILSLIYLFTFGMNFMANLSHIRSGRILSSIVAKLSNQPNPQSQLTPGGIIVLMWLLMWALSSILAKVYIHFSLKRRPQSMAIQVGLAISDKNYFAKDGIDGTIGLFRRNASCSAEQKHSRNSVPFRRGDKCSEFCAMEQK
jgi:hypothetical protein